MSLGTSNRDGGKTSESGHLRALGKTLSGDVISGLLVAQRAAGANMSVDIAIGDAFLRRSDGSYVHPVFNDAVYNQVISTADGSNPRRDIVVLYLDYAVTPVTTVSNNTNGVVKIKVVNGTPAGSPVDPTDAAIQSSVGAGNPWTKLARVRVPASQTSITNTLIDDLRVMIYNNAGTVNTAALIDAAVTTAKLLDANVTTAKVAAGAVTTAKQTAIAAAGTMAGATLSGTITTVGTYTLPAVTQAHKYLVIATIEISTGGSGSLGDVALAIFQAGSQVQSNYTNYAATTGWFLSNTIHTVITSSATGGQVLDFKASKSGAGACSVTARSSYTVVDLGCA